MIAPPKQIPDWPVFNVEDSDEVVYIKPVEDVRGKRIIAVVLEGE